MIRSVFKTASKIYDEIFFAKIVENVSPLTIFNESRIIDVFIPLDGDFPLCGHISTTSKD